MRIFSNQLKTGKATLPECVSCLRLQVSSAVFLLFCTGKKQNRVVFLLTKIGKATLSEYVTGNYKRGDNIIYLTTRVR